MEYAHGNISGFTRSSHPFDYLVLGTQVIQRDAHFLIQVFPARSFVLARKCEIQILRKSVETEEILHCSSALEDQVTGENRIYFTEEQYEKIIPFQPSDVPKPADSCIKSFSSIITLPPATGPNQYSRSATEFQHSLKLPLFSFSR